MGGTSKFVWHDFYAADVDAAKRFYGELFGWTFKPGDHGYQHIAAGGQEIGGILKLDPKHGAPPHWIGYVSVDDLDRAVAAVTKGGGAMYVREEIPNVGAFAVCADAQGAVFSPFHPARAAKPESNAWPPPYTFCWDELMTSIPTRRCASTRACSAGAASTPRCRGSAATRCSSARASRTRWAPTRTPAGS